MTQESFFSCAALRSSCSHPCHLAQQTQPLTLWKRHETKTIIYDILSEKCNKFNPVTTPLIRTAEKLKHKRANEMLRFTNSKQNSYHHRLQRRLCRSGSVSASAVVLCQRQRSVAQAAANSVWYCDWKWWACHRRTGTPDKHSDITTASAMIWLCTDSECIKPIKICSKPTTGQCGK